ncbi:MAG: PTS glucose transporter subunit IIABC, partial [Acidimicrobiia bacterium]|nr:PTS glucose transporter subunit IIABC [Acidimicrobiia bacterium]
MSDDIVYESAIVSVGSDVPMFAEEGMLIIFSDSAPDELRDVAVIHAHPDTEVVPERGDVVEIGSHAHRVTAVGDISGDNFRNLGHVTFKMNGLK